MIDEDRVEIAMRLMKMRKTLQSVIDMIAEQATLCDEAGAHGLSFSLLMLREAMAVYSKELNRTVTGYLSNESDA